MRKCYRFENIRKLIEIIYTQYIKNKATKISLCRTPHTTFRLGVFHAFFVAFARVISIDPKRY